MNPSVRYWYNEAQKIAARLPVSPALDHDDLVAEAMLGLVEAQRTWDGAKGLAWHNYARMRMRGAAIDAIRRARPFGRKSEQPGFVGVEDAEPLCAPCTWGDIEDRLGLCSLLSRVRMPARKVMGRLLAGETSRDVAASLRVHESRVSQIRVAAVAEMRGLL